MSDLPTREEVHAAWNRGERLNEYDIIIHDYAYGKLLSRAEWEATIKNARLRCAAHSFNPVYGARCSWANEIGREKAGPCDIGKYGFAAVGEETDRDTNDTRDTWHVPGCSLPGDHLADCFVPRRNRAVGEDKT